jgi:hypothetical protein
MNLFKDGRQTSMERRHRAALHIDSAPRDQPLPTRDRRYLFLSDTPKFMSGRQEALDVKIKSYLIASYSLILKLARYAAIGG